ncbi:MAG: SPOR domain-containing protein [Nitrospiraceae bacterium]|nr:SPOR domain-containing protein [Nitrospiraceae bacterium]
MSRNVLVIERDFETSRQIASALEGEGYFVFTASNAEAGLVMARRVKPALLFLNLSMKETGGVEFLKKLRAMDFLRSVPVLVLTNGQEEYEAKYAQLYGIVNFVNLPVNATEIIAKSKASMEHIPAPETVAKRPSFSETPASYGNIHVEAAQETGPGAESVSADVLNSGLGQDGPSQKHEKNENFLVRIDSEAEEDGPAAEHEAPGQPEPAPGPALETALNEDRADKDVEAGGPEKEKNSENSSFGFDSSLSDRINLAEQKANSGFEAHMKDEERTIEQAEAHKDDRIPFSGGLSPAPDDLMPDEREGYTEGEIMPSAFYGQKKKKKALSKGFLWMLGIVLLGAVSSFFFFMYMAPKSGHGKVFTQSVTSNPAENQPVIVDQNTPPASAGALVSKPGANIAGQQKTTQIQNQIAKNLNTNQNAVKPGQAQTGSQIKTAQAASRIKTAGINPVAQGRNITARNEIKTAQNPKAVIKEVSVTSSTANPAVKDKKAATIKASAVAHKPLGEKVKKVAANATTDGQVKNSRKSAGYWALLDKEEAQMEKQGSGKDNTAKKTGAKASAKGHAGKNKNNDKNPLFNARRLYSLQVGAFASRVNADKLSARLKSHGFNSSVQAAKKDGKAIYKVLVGKFSTPAQGKAAAQKLDKEGLKAFHIYE